MISGADIALWDIVGKAPGQPIGATVVALSRDIRALHLTLQQPCYRGRDGLTSANQT